jgi:hypothetical protein
VKTHESFGTTPEASPLKRRARMWNLPYGIHPLLSRSSLELSCGEMKTNLTRGIIILLHECSSFHLYPKVRKKIRKSLNDPDVAKVTKQNMDYRHVAASIQSLQQRT